MNMINRLASFIVVIMISFTFCSGPDDSKAVKKKTIEEHIKTFVKCETLESIGYEHFKPHNFFMMFEGDYLYLVNQNDHMVVKFKGNKPLKVYKAAEGQAPGEFISPRSIFLYDTDTIAIYDVGKVSVLLFDLELNYLKEIKLKTDFIEIAHIKKGLISVQDTRDYVFGFLDDHFNVVDNFVKARKKRPFKGYYLASLNRAFFLYGGLAAHTHGLHPRKDCRIDIYDLGKKQLVVSLLWEQPFSPTQKSMNERINMYFTQYIGKYGKYYVVQNNIVKQLMTGTTIYDLLIFNEKGELNFRSKFKHELLKFRENTDDTKVYFLDGDENLSFIDIKNLV